MTVDQEGRWRGPTICEGCGQWVPIQQHGHSVDQVCGLDCSRLACAKCLGKPAEKPDPFCVIDGCGKPQRSRGWCSAHYERWRLYADPQVKHEPLPLIDRLLRRYEVVGECWEWQGTRSEEGYGTIGGDYKTLLVHRVSYEHFVGPIPGGLHLDHLCRNRACLNPAHLEPVTPAENVRRSLPYRRKPSAV